MNLALSTPSDAVHPSDGLIESLLRGREELLGGVFADRAPNRLLLRVTLLVVTLTGSYGFIMGIDHSLAQAFSSMLKLPLLYLLSLAVCFPLLFVVNVLMGSRLNIRQTLALIQLALGLNAVLIGSCAPISLFFIVTGADYHFLKILHVGILGVAAFSGMVALYRGLVAMCESHSIYPRHAVRILLIWIFIFGFVGTQMAWTLRPFLGAPDLPFELLRENTGMTFYQAIWISIGKL